MDCSGLTSITIPDSVTKIGTMAFRNCTGLTSITIPDSVTEIGIAAFAYCTGLTNINVDKNNENYLSEDGILFNKDKTALVEYPEGKNGAAYTIPGSVTSICALAFAGCTGLTSITIPDSVTEIGGLAFYGCTGLTSITIPDSVAGIGMSAFAMCTGLTSIDVDKNNENYLSEDGVLFNKDKTSLIAYPGAKNGAYAIPDSVTSISNYAFANCTGLTSITIPASVTEIGDGVFDGSDNIVIHGYSGNYVETYANENGLTFVAISDEPSDEPSEEPSEEPSDEPSKEPTNPTDNQTSGDTGNTPDNDNTNTDMPQTGNNGIMLALAAFAAMVSGAVLTLFRRKKKTEK